MKTTIGVAAMALVLMGLAIAPVVTNALEASACPGTMLKIKYGTNEDITEPEQSERPDTCYVSDYATCLSCCELTMNYEMPRPTGQAQNFCIGLGAWSELNCDFGDLYKGYYRCD